ncbi:hypothetical protein EZV62_007681 [Acer yangbiense]|uniref:Uncharacterized protein n=1 Tax=Acer yangbiense TaxID=1000413 RepID=A0A5C7ID72_9ROSI|nr:hypothetical protein EZV62_007681 [Acer yangbiense]
MKVTYGFLGRELIGLKICVCIQGKKAAVGMIGFIGIMKIHKQCCSKEEIALKREKSLALAFSHQVFNIWRTDGRLAEEIIIGRWATRKQSWDSLDRVS